MKHTIISILATFFIAAHAEEPLGPDLYPFLKQLHQSGGQVLDRWVETVGGYGYPKRVHECVKFRTADKKVGLYRFYKNGKKACKDDGDMWDDANCDLGNFEKPKIKPIDKIDKKLLELYEVEPKKRQVGVVWVRSGGGPPEYKKAIEAFLESFKLGEVLHTYKYAPAVQMRLNFEEALEAAKRKDTKFIFYE